MGNDQAMGQLSDECQNLAVKYERRNILRKGRWGPQGGEMPAGAETAKTLTVTKGKRQSQLVDIELKQYRHVPKGVKYLTCSECHAYWDKTGSALTSFSSQETASASPTSSFGFVEAPAAAEPAAWGM